MKDPRPAILAILDEALDYFDNRADIDSGDPTGQTPNEELVLFAALTEARSLYIASVGDPLNDTPPPSLPSSDGVPYDSPLRQHPRYWWALAHRYSSTVAFFLPTPDGDFALYNCARDPSAFVPASTTLAAAYPLAPPPAPAKVERRMGALISGPRSLPDIDFDL